MLGGKKILRRLCYCCVIAAPHDHHPLSVAGAKQPTLKYGIISFSQSSVVPITMFSFSRISTLSCIAWLALVGLVVSFKTCEAFTTPTSVKQMGVTSAKTTCLAKAFIVKSERSYGQQPLFLSSENEGGEKKVGS